MPDSIRTSIAVPRPLRADARRNFEAIIASARTVFGESGADASLEEIARQAGVGIATLYRNFPNRSDLLEAVYFDEVEALGTTAQDLADLPPWDALVGWLRRFASYSATKKAIIDSLNRDTDAFRAARDALYAAGEPVLARAQAAGAARADTTIDDVMRLILGVLSTGVTGDDQRERMLGLALDGIRAR